MARLDLLFQLLIPAVILVHLFVAPYTKVEESFNIQAIHDILIYGVPTENASQFFTKYYDHVSFPGSVPRTFAGALILAGLSRPLIWLFSSPAQLQLLIRAVLGCCNAAALIALGAAVQKVFGRSAGIWYALLQASQFHVIYYASRTLPNMYAFVFSTIALRSLLLGNSTLGDRGTIQRRYRLSLYLLTVSGIVFRSELAILLGTITLYLLASQRISIPSTVVPAGLVGLASGLICTVPVDSYFWQTFPLWPEWTAFYYNTILGHSADWGTSPWHFYILNALPRLLLNPLTFLICMPLAVLSPATQRPSLDLLVPSLAFIGLYSFLPHKEWRFIIYIIPGLTAVSGAGAAWIWNRRAKSILYGLLSLALIASVLISLITSSGLLVISSYNYPGGDALSRLHEITRNDSKHYQVHLDNLACQTGATRFLEAHDVVGITEESLSGTLLDNGKIVLPERGMPQQKRRVTYDKTEDPSLLLDPLFWSKLDFVLIEKPEKAIGKWKVTDVVYGFSGAKILRPGQTSRELTSEEQELLALGDKRMEPRGIAKAWKGLEGVARARLLRGWWFEISMEPKIRILANAEKHHEV